MQQIGTYMDDQFSNPGIAKASRIVDVVFSPPLGPHDLFIRDNFKMLLWSSKFQFLNNATTSKE